MASRRFSGLKIGATCCIILFGQAREPLLARGGYAVNAHKIVAASLTPPERDFLTLVATGLPQEQAVESSGISAARAAELLDDPEFADWVKRTSSIINSSYTQATVKLRMLLPRVVERMGQMLDNGSEKAVLEVCRMMMRVFYENPKNSPHGNMMVTNVYSSDGLSKLKILSGDVIDITPED